MTSKTVSLGGGVTVREDPSGEIVVTSRRLELPWRQGTPVLPGTAVLWLEQLWEARSVTRVEDGEKWGLAPWPETEVVRNSDCLDRARIAELEAVAAAQERTRRMRDILMPILPLIGALPRRVQERLASDFNIPVGLATVISAAVEAVAGFVLFFVLRSGAWALPPAFAWVILFSPAMVLEGFVRMWFGLTQDEPIGSFVFSPLVLFVRARGQAVQTMEGYRPRVHRLDDGTGGLELVSEEPRWDWAVGGVLRFRQRLYRLVERSSREGQSLYLFEPVAEGAEATLSLMPPPKPAQARERGRGFGAEIMRFMLVSFAPREAQEVLVADMKVPGRLLTFVSASMQMIGGAVNLSGASAGDPMVLFDIGLLGEGLFRLVWAVASQAPVGSVLGLPFGGIYSVWVEEVEVSGTSASPQNGQKRKPLSEGN